MAKNLAEAFRINLEDDKEAIKLIAIGMLYQRSYMAAMMLKRKGALIVDFTDNLRKEAMKNVGKIIPGTEEKERLTEEQVDSLMDYFDEGQPSEILNIWMWFDGIE